MKKIKELFTIFFAMMKIGAFTFGGGYAMIALLENEFVGKRGWLEKDIALYSEEYCSPIGIYSIAYRFSIKGYPRRNS